MKWIPLAVAFAHILAVGAVEAAPGDLAVVRGSLEWPPALAQEPFIIVKGDDGRDYYADIATAQRTTRDALTAGSRVSLVALEGARAYELQALVFGGGDTALSRAPLPSPTAPSEPEWQRVEGVVESVSDRTLVVKSFDGRRVTVDVSNLNEPRLLRPGDTVKVFGAAAGGQDFVATGFIQARGDGASALPQGAVRESR